MRFLLLQWNSMRVGESSRCSLPLMCCLPLGLPAAARCCWREREAWGYWAGTGTACCCKARSPFWSRGWADEGELDLSPDLSAAVVVAVETREAACRLDRGI